MLRGVRKSHCQSVKGAGASMPPRRARDQQNDDALPPPPPPQLTLYERASVDMLAGTTRMLKRQSERPVKSHEEDVAEREHCDVLSMQIDSDLVIYRTTLVRIFQVVTICRVDKSEADEGVSVLVVDRIGDIYRSLPRRADVIVTTVGARHKCQQGKWVYLVTHAMSLFDLRDVCMVIGSLATLDLPMVVDLIGIYVLKGPYYNNTTLQTLDIAAPLLPIPLSAAASSTCRRPPPRAAACRGWTCSDRLDEEIPSVINSSRFLVQTDEGIVISVVDRIRRTTTANR
ncbi:pentatricopeptide repeat-containing protein-like [Dorcoceras hygrometricum]|uniref:Pentatricopeptide repeat-containing protein-like n=1 Tax=Dorcoceras hygrometricum TaxID=472368 RepID=A0A2Z7CHJ7_9LAMI|nr:pentatricopeptide repeat-containing protein-like [Dorcoceras hygrometricum]